MFYPYVPSKRAVSPHHGMQVSTVRIITHPKPTRRLQFPRRAPFVDLILDFSTSY